MPQPHDELPEDFNGVVRLFPLPNLVLFPSVMQPLHIFEPRYCEMLEDAMQDDQLIAMALLEPGWQKSYDGRPPVAPMACVGRVVSHAATGDGQHNILLRGLKRARIRRELPPNRAFRQAEVTLLDDVYSDQGAPRRSQLHKQLVDLLRRLLPASSPAQQQFDQLLGTQVQLGTLTDVVAFTVQLSLATKQQLLTECDVDRRAELLVDAMGQLVDDSLLAEIDDSRKFPPDFSSN